MPESPHDPTRLPVLILVGTLVAGLTIACMSIPGWILHRAVECIATRRCTIPWQWANPEFDGLTAVGMGGCLILLAVVIGSAPAYTMHFNLRQSERWRSKARLGAALMAALTAIASGVAFEILNAAP